MTEEAEKASPSPKVHTLDPIIFCNSPPLPQQPLPLSPSTASRLLSPGRNSATLKIVDVIGTPASSARRRQSFSSIQMHGIPSTPMLSVSRRGRSLSTFSVSDSEDTPPNTRHARQSITPPSVALDVLIPKMSIGECDSLAESREERSSVMPVVHYDCCEKLPLQGDTAVASDNHFIESELLLYRNFGHQPHTPKEAEGSAPSHRQRSTSMRSQVGWSDPPISAQELPSFDDPQAAGRRRTLSLMSGSGGNDPREDKEDVTGRRRAGSTLSDSTQEVNALAFVADRSRKSPHSSNSSPNLSEGTNEAHVDPTSLLTRVHRGSWSEIAPGIPRGVSSTAMRTPRNLATLIDMEQEFTRYASAENDGDGECNCDEKFVTRHARRYENANLAKVDCVQLFSHCSWCARRPAAFLCLNCCRAVCPSHVKVHAMDDEKCNGLFLNILDITVSFDRIFWCEKCTRFTWKFTDVYNALADRLVETRGTYLDQPATDIFMRHFQIDDKGSASYRAVDASSNLTNSKEAAPETSSTQSSTPLLSPIPTTQKIFASVASMQGWRSTQEDSEVVFHIKHCSLISDLVPTAPVLSARYTAFCVFDGHGGDTVAKVAAHNIEDHFRRELVKNLCKSEFQVKTEGQNELTESLRRKLLTQVLEHTFLSLDRAIQNTPEGLEGQYAMVGCTAIMVLVTESDIVCASCGDSRAIIYDPYEKTVYPLSEDHKLSRESERQRVLGAGYTIQNGRIEGMLGVPRALGDYDFKMCGSLPADLQAVSPKPDVTWMSRARFLHLPKNPTEEESFGSSQTSGPVEDWFLVIACDGIWDVLDNSTVSNIISEEFQIAKRNRQLDLYVAASLTGSFSSPSPRGSPHTPLSLSPLTMERRNRTRSSFKKDHPYAQMPLHANTINDCIAEAICAVLKRAVAVDDSQAEEGLGMDNMSIIVASLKSSV